MTRRLIRAAFILLVVLSATTFYARPPRGECYPGGTFTNPEGFPECFPGAGSNCLYCEF